ncbi:16S rRNA processing protein RimM [Actinomycetales bacterium JB111]|nr:16S rRNA processing protein RimM [Actinomycetales bacterium JB111]
MQLTVAVIGAPHALKGEVRLDVRTDDPERRLAVGATIETEPADAGPLTIASHRLDRGATFVRFEGAEDRTAAESLRGVRLVVESDEDEDEDEDDAWYPHELAGLRADHVDGRHIGEVTGLRHAPGHDLLMIKETAGGTTAVPFVSALVPEVDVPGGRVVLDPPRGLLAADPLDDEPDPED